MKALFILSVVLLPILAYCQKPMSNYTTSNAGDKINSEYDEWFAMIMPDSGFTGAGFNQLSCTLEIFDTNTGNTSTSYLFKPAVWSNVSGENVVIKNNKILYIRCYTGSGDPNSHFDIYDIATANWSVGILPRSMNFTSVVSLNNKIYVSDGSEAWKLEF